MVSDVRLIAISVSDAVPDPQEVELLMRYRRLPSNKRRIAMQILHAGRYAYGADCVSASASISRGSR